MSIQEIRRERFIEYATFLRERFHSGMLSELQPLPQWVVWRGEIEDGKNKKVPYNPNYRNAHASVKIPKSWGTLERALQAVATGNYSGLGFMITPPLVFLDLDHCFEKETRTIIDPQAAEIVQTLHSYTEVSPSRRGLHILAYGNLPGRGIHTAIEMYGQERFTTITLDTLEEAKPIALRQEALEALYHRFAPRPAPTAPGTTEHGLGGVAGSRFSELPPEAAQTASLPTADQRYLVALAACKAVWRRLLAW